jgi:hypothetical protein
MAHREKSQPAAGTGSRLIVWVAVAFFVQAVVWTGWLTFAAQHRVAEVPLAVTPGR